MRNEIIGFIIFVEKNFFFFKYHDDIRYFSSKEKKNNPVTPTTENWRRGNLRKKKNWTKKKYSKRVLTEGVKQVYIKKFVNKLKIIWTTLFYTQ